MPQNNIYASYMPSAVIQLQSLARARQAKQRMAKLRAERVRDATAYKSYLSSHTQDNTQGLLAWAGLDLLDNFLPVLRAAIAKHKGLKLHVSALWLGSNFGQVESFWATTPLRHTLSPQEVFPTLQELKDALQNVITQQELTGSGWEFLEISTLELHIAAYQPLGGAAMKCWVPDVLKGKKALLNIAFPDFGGDGTDDACRRYTDRCFQFAVLAALFPAQRHPERAAQYEKHQDELDWTGVVFPMKVKDINKFEQLNPDVSVNVYGWEEKSKLVPEVEDEFMKWWEEVKDEMAEQTPAAVKDRQLALRHYRKAGFKVRTEDTGSHAYPLRITQSQRERHVDLVLLFNEHTDMRDHYIWVKHFSRFACGGGFTGHRKMQYCKTCMTGFNSEEKLQRHLSHGCQAITECRPCMPELEEDGSKPVIAFKDSEKHIKMPYVIYADFEALLPHVEGETEERSGSYTKQLQEHQPCGYCYYVVSADPAEVMPPPKVYRGADTITHFINAMQNEELKLGNRIHENTPMKLSPEQEAEFKCATDCIYCQKPLGRDRVRDHNHQTGDYRGAAHNRCNLREGLKNTKNFTIPVFFHNLKGYDGHHIMTEVGKFTHNFSAIPLNFEKMISFSFGHLRFLDSAAFLNDSLDNLSANLHEKGKGKDKFFHTARHCPKPEHLDLLLRKGIYPYEYMNSWERFQETQLPAQEFFHSKLTDGNVSAEDYQHGQVVWDAFDCKHLGDYHDLYMKSDVLLLADVFEAHRQNCLQHYSLDPAHYFTTPNFAWDAMLKKTDVRLELLTDYDMYLFIEQGLRGGISMITHRHAQANNPSMEDYDADEKHRYIMYLDANNLYGKAMVQTLPHSEFKWSGERDIDVLIARYGNPVYDEDGSNESEGCFVKVDIHYPPHLHDAHNDYPLAPEKMLVTNELLSPYAVELQEKLGLHEDTIPKLVPNLMDKQGYVCDIRAIKYYQEQGLVVTRVHAVLTFKQSTWMTPYIAFNTSERAKAKNDFEKDFFKLMSNACFGKTMENVRGHLDLTFISSNAAWGSNATKNDRTIMRKLASPLYQGHIIYNADLAAIKRKKKKITLNKPIYAGLTILDQSKLHMYDFHYDFIKPKYGEKAKLLFTDTDSLTYLIETDNFYEDMWAHKELYDLSGYPKDSKYYDTANKKVLGKFKDECDGAPVSEFIGLRPKMYSLKYGESKEKQTGKGIKTDFVKKHISHEDYSRCLLSAERADQQQIATFVKFNTKKHIVTTDEVAKVGLCCYDNKRYLLGDGITSYSYGHYRITHPEEIEPEPEV